MPLAAGTRLGHYSVTALIGEGGMGQVYRATDTKLNRQVALKIPIDWHGSSERRGVDTTSATADICVPWCSCLSSSLERLAQRRSPNQMMCLERRGVTPTCTVSGTFGQRRRSNVPRGRNAKL